MYKFFLRPFLFLFDPETVHHFTFTFLKYLFRIPFVSTLVRVFYAIEHPSLERELFGIKFPNPVGLAAGFDKDGKLYEELSNFGFGFVEIGTLTPKPQEGNPKKRLFRLKKMKGIINRMGFNNEGVEAARDRLKSTNKKIKIIIGGNIGKNKITPNEEALKDYMFCFESLYDFVDYFVVNVSSPNTPNLRELQEREPLENILNTLQRENAKKESKPIFLKIAPDLSQNQLLDIIEIIYTTKITGLIATNTTLERPRAQDENIHEMGGLSGEPLREKSTEVIKFIVNNRKEPFVIIGVGGIHTAEDALEKLNAGANLIQIYTGFIYEGPRIIKAINKELIKQSISIS